MGLQLLLEFDDEFPGERRYALTELGSGGGNLVEHCCAPCWSLVLGRNGRR